MPERDALISQFSFAIPTEEALEAIAGVSPGGVLELGAGTGYWARLLHERGVDVVAYDLFPPPASENRWFSGVTPWFHVARGDEAEVTRDVGRALLLVWPTRNEEWAARAATDFHTAGGETLIYVGEGPGGRTGDDQFHALLGYYDRCLACAYDLADLACICGVVQQWQLRTKITLPHMKGFDDDLHIYQRLEAGAPLGQPRSGSRRRTANRG